MRLRKWRSDSCELLQSIPDDLKETEAVQTINAPDQCHKALGVHWHTTQDTLHVATPILDSCDRPIKHQVASDVARTFDIMGWFAPSIIHVKILLQKLWQLRIDWDQLVQDDIAREWQCWRKELPHLTQYPVPRCYYTKDKRKISTQFHGFCDASQQAYAGAGLFTKTLLPQSLWL